MARFPGDFLQKVRDNTNILDVVGSYVSLKKKGKRYWACCPFHQEKTPSFSVSPEDGLYYCFGCHAGGDVFSFVEKMENLSFTEAVERLAEAAHLELPQAEVSPEEKRRKQFNDELYHAMELAVVYFHNCLRRTNMGKPGLAYFKRRHLTDETIDRFKLGFAPDSWHKLYGDFRTIKHISDTVLVTSGLVGYKNGRYYDTFRNRCMFPILNLKGKPVAFGGRVMDDSTPKYLNSPDTPVYNKSRNVFALNIAKKSRAGRVILTEGYMDTISLHQAGFDSAVASLGTSLTAEHAQLLARYFKDAVIAYDGDGAGVSAAQRAIPLLERAGLNVKVLRVKGAKDPDEFIKKYGPEAFARLLDKSENHIDYRLEQLRGRYDLSDDSQRVEFLREATGVIASLHSAVEREIYGGHAAQMAGISAEAMAQEVKKELRRRIQKEKKQQERRDLSPAIQLQPKARGMRYDNIRSARAEEGVLRLILLDSSLLEETEGLTGSEFSSPLLGRIFDLLRSRAAEGLSTQLPALAGALEPEEMAHLAWVAEQPENLANSRRALADYIALIREEGLRRSGTDEEALLRAAQKRYQETKAYMEEKP